MLNSYGVNDGGRTLGAVLVDEKIRIWRGEPFERAMANFYLGLVYYMRQDYANARGASRTRLFKLRDYGAEAKADQYEAVETNFAQGTSCSARPTSTSAATTSPATTTPTPCACART